MKITYHNNDVRNEIDISNSVIILSLEPHKFDSRRAFIIAIHENGRRFANTVWIKYIPEGKKTWKINTNTVTDLKFDGTFEMFLDFLRTDKRFYAKSAEDLLKEASFIAKKWMPNFHPFLKNYLDFHME